MQSKCHYELCTANGQELSYLFVEESAILKCRFLNKEKSESFRNFSQKNL